MVMTNQVERIKDVIFFFRPMLRLPASHAITLPWFLDSSAELLQIYKRSHFDSGHQNTSMLLLDVREMFRLGISKPPIRMLHCP